MPYIEPNLRSILYPHAKTVAENPGELNYQLTMLLKLYWDTHTQSYRTANDILGALEACKIEFYQRKVVPLELEKLAVNGDIW